MYTEADGRSNMEFVLELLPVLSSSITLEFWYHMYGSSMGTLSVEVSSVGSDQPWVSVWSVSGQQQLSTAEDWRHAVVPLGGA